MGIILASASPRRRELLSLLGVPFTVITAPVAEPPPDPALSPPENLRAITSAKLAPVAAAHSADTIIAADTVVVLDNTYFGKPTDSADAARMLRALSGKTHEVYTGVIVQNAAAAEFAHARTRVTFRELSDTAVAAYVATGEPMDKAGAYGIQGAGARLVARIDGDYYNVMGLPLGLLRGMLHNIGLEL
ncbi:MAG: Maf family protein [Oscillospiraceae bacterium]|jgi:septum formation protein|nr:Maf family protein [Oscillospiraceae bacterium]